MVKLETLIFGNFLAVNPYFPFISPIMIETGPSEYSNQYLKIWWK